MYSELRNPDRYPDETSPWTYLGQPAVLQFADDAHDWVTLWPRSNMREVGFEGEADDEGLFPKWSGPMLARRRGQIAPRTWSMVYMQQQLAEDAVFAAEDVKGCVNGLRMPGGPLVAGAHGHRFEGMDGCYVVAGLDPAGSGSESGCTAAVVLAVDRMTAKRYILDVHNQPQMVPDDIRDLVKTWTTRYGIHEWRIEQNAFQTFLVQDREINQFLASKGVILQGHYTGKNKLDPELGVMSMSGLFKGHERGENLIELPSTKRAEAAKALVEQLITWFPNAPRRQKTDIVMALWFADLRAREINAFQGGKSHASNQWMSPRDRESQVVVNIDEFLSGRLMQHGFEAVG